MHVVPLKQIMPCWLIWFENLIPRAYLIKMIPPTKEAAGTRLSEWKWLIIQEERNREDKYEGIKLHKYFHEGSFPEGHWYSFASLNFCKGRWPSLSVALPGPSDEVLDIRAKRLICVPSSALTAHHFALSFLLQWKLSHQKFAFNGFPLSWFFSICEKNIAK